MANLLGRGRCPRWFVLGLLCLLQPNASRSDEVPAELEAAAEEVARTRAGFHAHSEHAQDLQGHPESDIHEVGRVASSTQVATV